MTSDAFQRSANWVVAVGIILVLIGTLAILAPLATGIAIETLVGVLFILGGIAELFYAIRAASFGGGPLSTVSGILSLVCGILMVLHPILGLQFLTLLLAGYFLVDGIARIVLASRLRDMPGSGWMLFDGIVTVALAVLIFAQWPLSGEWAIGLLVGINLLLTGWAILATGLAAKRFLARHERGSSGYGPSLGAKSQAAVSDANRPPFRSTPQNKRSARLNGLSPRT